MAGASVLLARLPQGLDTLVGDRGTLLSGGERQRLALARALLRRPRLLVLDEATSALDPESERAIRQTIASLTPAVTVLTITHRLTTARQADHVVVLDHGVVVAEGPWEALLEGEGSRLARLWTAQLGLDDDAVAQGILRSS
jgi:ABC-type multidrug transport system fused ATPase/permease subunit